MHQRRRGKVVWFNQALGYGFCRPDEPGAADVFISADALAQIRVVEKGDVLEFSLQTDRRGRYRAKDISLVRAGENGVTLMPGSVPAATARIQ